MSSARSRPLPHRNKHRKPDPGSDAAPTRPPAPPLVLPVHPTTSADLSAFSHAAADLCAAHQAHIKATANHYPARLQHSAHDRFARLRATQALVDAKHSAEIKELERQIAEVEEAMRLDPKPELPEQFEREEMRLRNQAGEARLEAGRLRDEVDELKDREAWLEAEVARLENQLSVPEPVTVESLILTMYHGLDLFFDPQAIPPPTKPNRRMSMLKSATDLDQALAQDLPPLPEPVLPESIFVISTETQDGAHMSLDPGWEANVLMDGLWNEME